VTLGRASMTGAAVVGAFLIGIWVGPRVMRGPEVSPSPVGLVPGATPEETAAALADEPPLTVETTRSGARPTRPPALKRVAAPSVAASVPLLQKRLKPLLNQGADMRIASEGFRDGEQFATLAHAARNVDVPFMLLKHQVLNQGQTLAEAIRSSKPELNATIEAERAGAEARSDVAALD
jgi:hypothetical protein